MCCRPDIAPPQVFHVNLAANAGAAQPAMPQYLWLNNNAGAAPVTVHIPFDTGCAAPAPTIWWPMQLGG